MLSISKNKYFNLHLHRPFRGLWEDKTLHGKIDQTSNETTDHKFFGKAVRRQFGTQSHRQEVDFASPKDFPVSQLEQLSLGSHPGESRSCIPVYPDCPRPSEGQVRHSPGDQRRSQF